MLSYAVSADPSLVATLDDLRHDLERGHSERVVIDLRDLSVIAPEVGEVWELLTLACLARGDAADALDAAAQLRAVAPGPTAYLLNSQALLGHDNVEALNEAENARAAAPAVWVTHAQVARCFGAKGADLRRRDIEAAEQAVWRAPREAAAHAVLARVLLNHDRLDEAEQSARTAMQLNSRDPEAQRIAGDIIAERSLRSTRAERLRTGRADVARAAARLLNRVVSLEISAVAIAAIGVHLPGASLLGRPALPMLVLLALMVGVFTNVHLTVRHATHHWSRLVPCGREGLVVAGGFALMSLLVVSGLALTAWSADPKLRHDCLLLAAAGMVGAVLIGLPAAARCGKSAKPSFAAA